MPTAPAAIRGFVDAVVVAMEQGAVHTDLGRVVARRRTPMVGRNPIAGAPIAIAGHTILALVPSEAFQRAALAGLDWSGRLAKPGEIAAALEVPADKPAGSLSCPALAETIAPQLRACAPSPSVGPVEELVKMDGLGSFGTTLIPRSSGWEMAAAVCFRPDSDLKEGVDGAQVRLVPTRGVKA